jgi:hypothetical protein
MRSLGTALSLSLSVMGFTIALMGPALAPPPPPISAPEPMSVLVFGAGLVGAAVVTRRKKK